MTEVSSGEARRAIFARALVHDPKALILDEPMNSLDVRAQREVREAMRKLAQSGVSVVLVTHHLPDIIPEIGRVISLREGQLVGDGGKAAMLTAPRLSDLFGIDVQVKEVDGLYHMW